MRSQVTVIVLCLIGAGLIPSATHAQPARYQTVAQAASSTSVPHIVPTWRSKATGDDMVRVYPRSALRRGLAGIAIVQCSVTAAGEMTDCDVEQEAPLNEGFGAAALQLMPRFRMQPQTDGGAPVAGGVVRLPIQFRPPH